MFKLSIISAFLVVSIASLSAPCWAQKDPTKPFWYGEKSTLKKLQLQSIMIGKGRKSVLINGQYLHENQSIVGSDGVKVFRIEAYRVTLIKNDKRWFLKLRKSAQVKK